MRKRSPIGVIVRGTAGKCISCASDQINVEGSLKGSEGSEVWMEKGSI